jgi:hypothetical protein
MMLVIILLQVNRSYIRKQILLLPAQILRFHTAAIIATSLSTHDEPVDLPSYKKEK